MVSIKGITIEIGGDTTKLQKALKEVDSQLRSNKSQLKDVSRLLKLDPGNAEVLNQKYKLLNDSIEKTKNRLQTLKNASEEAAKTAGNYNAWKEKHDSLQKEIGETSAKLKDLKVQSEECDKKIAEETKARQKYDNLQDKIEKTENALEKLKEQSEKADEKLANGKITTEKYEKLQDKISETESKLKSLKDQSYEAEQTLNGITIDTAEYDGLQSEIDETEEKLKSLEKQVKETSDEFGNPASPEEWDALQREITETEANLKQLNKEMKEFGSVSAQGIAAAGEKVVQTSKKVEKIGKGLSTNVTIPITAAFGASAKAAIDFESAMTGVKKTNEELVDENGNVIISYKDLAEAIEQMATETASGKEEIAGVMEAAGQLGVGTKYLEAFTRAMIMIGDSTNLSAEDAATAIAKLANVTGMSLDEVDRFGASLVALGNNFATDEQSIMNMATRLAGAGNQIGLSEGEILGMATALSSVGIEAEMGGSAFSKAMIKMQMASETGYEQVKELENATGMSRRELELLASNSSKDFKALADSMGMTQKEMNNIVAAGKNLEDFAKVAGMTADEFVTLFRDNAPAAIQAFISGLGDVEGHGESTIQMLQDMGFTEVRLRDTLTRLASSGDLVSNAVSMGNTAWSENSALAEEAGKRYETTEAQISQLKETLSNLAISVGEIILPVVREMADTLKDVIGWLNSMDEGTKELIVKTAAFAAAAGPVLYAAAKIGKTVGSIMKLAPKIVTGINNVMLVVAKIIPVLKGLWAVIAANPIILIAAAIAAAIAAFIHFWNTSEGFRQFWYDLGEKLVAIWNSVKEAFVTIWNTILSAGQAIFGGIVSFFTNVWGTVADGASTAWNNIRGFLSETWEGIREKAGEIWGNVKDKISELTETAGEAIREKWEDTKSDLGTLWEDVSSKAETIWGNIKSTMSSVTDTIKSTLQEKWNSIKTAYEEHGGRLKSIATDTIDAIKERWTTGIDTLKSLIGDKLDSVKQAFSDAWENVKTTVHDAIEKIKSFFNFEWELPKIKLPQFSIKGKFSLNPPQVPTIGVEWYRKAMNNGMILTSPTIFGAANGKLLAGGEAGPEAVIGTNSLSKLITDAVARGNAGQTVNITRNMPRTLHAALYLKDTEIGHVLVPIIDAENQRIGVKLEKGVG